jgi:hypothetical protein
VNALKVTLAVDSIAKPYALFFNNWTGAPKVAVFNH